MFDHARAQESEDARRECPTTSALTHFRERSRDSLLIADFCSCSSGSMHVLKTMLFAFGQRFTAGCFALAQMSTLASARCKRAWNPRPNWVCTLTHPSAQGLQSSIGDS